MWQWQARTLHAFRLDDVQDHLVSALGHAFPFNLGITLKALRRGSNNKILPMISHALPLYPMPLVEPRLILSPLSFGRIAFGAYARASVDDQIVVEVAPMVFKLSILISRWPQTMRMR